MSTRTKPSGPKYSWKYWSATRASENLFSLSSKEFYWYRLLVDGFYAAGFKTT